MKTTPNILSLRILITAAALTAGEMAVFGISPRFDVTSSRPVVDHNELELAGNNPAASNFGMAVQPGCLIQIIDAGPDGIANLPNLDGTPGGDDTVIGTASIGEGIAPNLAQSGMFSTSFYPPPPAGSRVYARAFNGPTVETSTYWGQSAIHTVQGSAVFDVSEKGLITTSLLVGSDPVSTDSDGDGMTDYEELVANTGATDGSDVFTAGLMAGDGAVEIDGRAGRSYVLSRSTDDLKASMHWETVAASPVLTVSQGIVLSDPSPPAGEKAFYRIEAINP